MIDFALLIFQVWHTTTNSIGIIFNLLLIYLCLFKSPKIIRSYSILILNFAISDLGACITDVFVEQRLIPAGVAVFYISNGICTYFSRTACYIGYSLMLHFYSHSLWSLLLSFSYRYYILLRHPPSRSTLVIILLIIYTPSCFQLIAFLLANDDQAKVEEHLRNRFPTYDLTNKTITGTLNILQSWPAMFTILHMTLPISPVYFAILILRKKIIRHLEEVAVSMSTNTRYMHEQLLQALTLQALLPFFFLVVVASYTIGQLGIYNSPSLEYLTLTSGVLIPLLSPCINIYFVRPYKSTLVLWFYRLNNLKARHLLSPQTTTTMFDPGSNHKKQMSWRETDNQSGAGNTINRDS